MSNLEPSHPEMANGQAPEVSIIIVNYRTPNDVLACIASLVRLGGGLKLEIIVVDNASGDGSAERIRTACPPASHPMLKVIDAGANRGFAAGNNVGLKLARGQKILLLNPDTEMPAGVLEAVCSRLDSDPLIGVIGVPQTVGDGETVGSALRALVPSHYLWQAFLPPPLIGWFAPSHGARYEDRGHREEFPCDAVVGCFMAMRREVYEAVGGLNERIFMYAEEIEYCHRVRRAGYTVLHMGGLNIVHNHGASTHSISVWRDVQIQQGQLVCIRLTRGVGAARLAAAAMSFSHLTRLPIELARPGKGWRTRLDSRLKRLRRSLRAIVTPPERSVQAI